MWKRKFLFLALAVIASSNSIWAQKKNISSYIKVPNLQYATLPKTDIELNMLDVYMPKKGSKSPAIVWIHGGGWSYGDKDDVQQKAEYFTAKGYAFISINYRLSPKTRHPAQAQDVADAIVWIYNNAKHYSVDENRIFLMGHTAGAHLAALVSVDEEYIKNAGGVPGIIKSVILLDGTGYDIKSLMPDVKGEKIEDWYLQTFGTTKTEWDQASPVNFIQSGKHLPPFMIVYVGKYGTSKAESLMLSAKLTEARVYNKVFYYEKKNPLTLTRSLGKEEDKPTEDVFRFLQELSYNPINSSR